MSTQRSRLVDVFQQVSNLEYWEERLKQREAEATALDSELEELVELAVEIMESLADYSDVYMHPEWRMAEALADFQAAQRKPVDKPRRRPLPNSLRKKVFERDQYRCRLCGDWHNLSVDHIHPVAHGGTDDMENLQTLCQTCNSRKGAKV